MVGKTVTLAVAAVLASTAEASPFFKWSWGGFTHAPFPSIYGPSQPEHTQPAWPWWPGYPVYTTTAVTTSSKHSSSSTPTSHAVTSTTPLSTATVSASKSITTSASSKPSGTIVVSSTPSASATVSSKNPSTAASVSISSKSASGTFPISTLPVTESASSQSASKSKVSACSRRSKTLKSGSASVSLKTSSASASGTASTKATVSSGGGSSSSAPSASLSISRTRASGSAVSTGVLPTGTGLSPCASIAQLVATQSVSGTARPTVPAKLGYDCLNSIPFNQTAAVGYLDSIRPFLDWQSTLEYVKQPPAEYAAKIQPAYDFRANYERIYSQAKAGDYANEYQFGFDVYRAFQRVHDGHFVIYPSSVTTLITFGRRTPLVSVSLDGISIPEVYVYSDVLAASFGNTSFTPSALTQINGRNSTEYLLDWAQNGSLQDRDALWNNMFYELAQVALGSSGTGTGTFAGNGRGRLVYPGPITTLAFANGTGLTYENFARVLVSFNNITSGADLYKKYLAVPGGEPQGALLQATSTSSRSAVASTRAPSSSRIVTSSRAASTARSTGIVSTSTIPAPGYPTNPVVREKNNLNAGYFLEGAGYDDVAVLAVNSFVGTDTDELDFQAVNTYLIDQAVKYNKTKLIVDVSANGGGTILQGYDLFKQLFPTIEPYGANRIRAHEAVNIIGKEYSAYSERVPRNLNQNATALDIISSQFNYQTDLDINEKPFTSWEEKYGPFSYGPQPDNFSATFRWNLSDVLTPVNSGGIYVSGYLNRSNITVQPFKAENIVVVTDGYCASTCTIFSELMRQQGGVKYVALGGRPNKDITQAVGGVKGTNDLPYAYILSVIEQVFAEPLLDTRENYNKTILGSYNDQVLLQSSASVINARDGLRQGDASNTPLQFVYEPADCRIYYTPEMTVDITAAWKAVADSAFNGVNRCVAGSLGSTAAPQKRGLSSAKQHSAHEKRMLFDSVGNIHIGQGSVVRGADSIMII